MFLHIGRSVDQPAIGACAFEIRPAAVALDAVMHAPLAELEVEVEVVRSRDAQPGVSNGRKQSCGSQRTFPPVLCLVLEAAARVYDLDGRVQ
jgi:hypothetical protein